MAVLKGERVRVKDRDDEVWVVMNVWNTRTEGWRADLQSEAQPAVSCSVNCNELERLEEVD
jgi:hypothetical protein